MKTEQAILILTCVALCGCGPNLNQDVSTGRWMPATANNGIHYDDGFMSARYFYEFDIPETDFVTYVKAKGFPPEEISEPVHASRYPGAAEIPLVKNGLFYRHRKDDTFDLLVYDRNSGRAYVYFQIR